MAQKVMTHVVQPDGTIIEVHDHGRGQANGVATLNNNGTLDQSLPTYASLFPGPNGGSLVDWVVSIFNAM